MFRACRVLVVAALATAVVGIDVRAGQPPTLPRAEPTRQTMESLGAMLTDMGLNPEKADGGAFHRVQVNRKDGAWSKVYLSVAPSGRYVWLKAVFNLPPYPVDQAPAAAWRKVVEANDRIGPASFYYHESNKCLYLQRALPNEDLTPAALRKALSEFGTTIDQTRDVWGKDAFVPEPTAEARDLLGRLAGKWQVVGLTSAGVAADTATLPTEPLTIADGRFRWKTPGGSTDARMHLTPGDGCFNLDLVTTYDLMNRALVKVQGDTLTLVIPHAGTDRPADFTSTAENKYLMVQFKRIEM